MRPLSPRERLLGAALLTLGVLAVSTGAVFARLAEAPALVKATWRCAIATAALVALGAPVLLQVLMTAPRRVVGLAALSGLFLAAHFATWIASLDHTSVATSLLLVNTIPVWVVLLAPLVNGERATLLQLAGVALALGGGAWLALDGEAAASAEHQRGLLGPGLAVLGALGATAYLVIGRRIGQRLPLVGYLAVCYGTATLALAAAATVAGTSLVAVDASAWIWIAALGLVPQLIGHSACNAALRRLPALLVALPLLLEPVVGSWLAWWILDETPPARTLSAGGLTLFGIALAAWPAGGGPKQSTRALSSPPTP